MPTQNKSARTAKKPPPKIQRVRWKGSIPRAKIRKAIQDVLKGK